MDVCSCGEGCLFRASAADFEESGSERCQYLFRYGQKFFRFDLVISPIYPQGKVTTVLVMGRLMEAALREPVSSKSKQEATAAQSMQYVQFNQETGEQISQKYSPPWI